MTISRVVNASQQLEEIINRAFPKLEQLPPMDETSFRAKIGELVGAYTKGKDASKLRIVVKRKESEA